MKKRASFGRLSRSLLLGPADAALADGVCRVARQAFAAARRREVAS